ncbi:aldo/keto reductase [Lapidilactobacillus mulanensis]|uniref:Aldo/keto reductase n=1 Tax=Lapidilactobacillus mulanensis TaxID=2485999 RepID=A0ABW4DM81_9LACO|nr:aldo/keto reductase [Lapidilactobacillus mulanensis]
MKYNVIPNSGLKIPAISLGFWHNFGDETPFYKQREIVRGAFELGITHFDLANNYGPRPGAAEENFGKIYAQDLRPYRDELVISSKAGYDMWQGPYGDGGSKKYIVASCDQSLARTGLDYFDIFYSHRRDPETPLAATAEALDYIVRSGRALYVGISNYSPADTKEMIGYFEEMKTPFVLHQTNYSLLNQGDNDQLKEILSQHGAGCIAYSPLAQGQLTNKYLHGIPEDSRAKSDSVFLNVDGVEKNLNIVRQLNEVAIQRGQTLAEMSIAWLLQDKRMTSVIVGASRLSQLKDNVAALNNLEFSKEELAKIDHIVNAK